MSAATSASRSDARLLEVGLLGLVARLGVAEVEVARDAQHLGGADRRARAARAVGDVGLDGAEVDAAVEDDGQGVGQREPVDLERDGDRRLRVDQGAPEDRIRVVAAPASHAPRPPSLPSSLMR